MTKVLAIGKCVRGKVIILKSLNEMSRNKHTV